MKLKSMVLAIINPGFLVAMTPVGVAIALKQATYVPGF
jgi:hypothetical protein